jgi:predicted TIM-barrel fold metal-dependent hydrolase
MNSADAQNAGIDGGVFLGCDETSGRGWPLERIVSTLDRLDVAQALAVSWRAVWFNAAEGNASTLAAATAADGRLLPMAVINLFGYDPHAGIVARLRQSGFSAIALFPGLLGWSLGRTVFRTLAREAANQKVAMQLCLREPGDLNQVANVLSQINAPTMVRWMRGSGYANVPDLLAVAADCPSAVFDVGTLTQRGAIDYIVERIGADRLFIASGVPAAHGAAPWFLYAAADLSDEARRLIGGGTLARLLGLPEPKKAPLPRDFDTLIGRSKIDTHWHTSSWNIIEPRNSFSDLSAAIERYHLQFVITSSIRALSDDLVAGNEETLRFLDSEPHARGLIVVNPLKLELSITEIEKYKEDSRFVGIKTIQDFYGLRLDSPLYRPILDHLIKYSDLPFMAHLPGMKEAAEEYPTVQFIAAHSTWRHRELAHLPNVWFDIATSTPLVNESDIADLIEAVSPQRILFSSDAPLMDVAFTLGKLALIDLPDRDLQDIFIGNATRAFQRLGSAPI